MDFLDKLAFEYGLKHTLFFRNIVRHDLYKIYGPDPEDVHEAVLSRLHEFTDLLKKYLTDSSFPELDVTIKGKKIKPFGTAAGFDKDGRILKELSYIFGFQESGTVIVHERKGNNRPRVYADSEQENLYNAQGFPSKGLSYFLENIKEYRSSGFTKPIYVNVCGLPNDNNFDAAYEELGILVEALNDYSDGFVWNPFSPNTASLKQLRTPEVFRKSSELIRKLSGDKLLLVKMGPYDKNGLNVWLDLTSGFLEGGGDGLVTVNTYMVPKEEVPSKEWGYPSAGKSGRFLENYRKNAVVEARTHFPDAIIFATGGIYDGDDAYKTFELGADAIEGYTPYTYYGLGLVRKLMKETSEMLENYGWKNLEEVRSMPRPIL